MAAQNSSPVRNNQFGNISFREIHKNAWLKRVSSPNIKKKREKFWVVFCVHDDTDAFLETYVDNKIAVLHKPDWFVYLNDVQHISPAIGPDQEQEYEFALTLKRKVVRLTAPSWDQMLDWVASLQAKLHELRILTPKDNLYSKLPENRPLLASSRDPNSPLPPPPPVVDLVAGVEAIQIARETQVFNFEPVPQTHYDRIFNSDTPGPSTSHADRNDRPILEPAPQPHKTFREQQVLQLQKEMQHSAGVKLQLRKTNCNSIAFVEAFDCVWVSGWKQKEHPMLYNVLHIGDRVVSIAGLQVKSAPDAYGILGSRYCGLFVDLVIKRVPHGQIFLLHREAEGQPLGIVQENNTAIIETVEADSLAARQGLSAKASTCDGLSLTNWVLTEINGRPLNLFFKKNQVKDRLNSIGRDISILVQPLDLIKQLKKELKSLRNYKEYLLQ